MVREIARQCGTVELVAVWHVGDEEPHVLGSIRSASVSCTGIAPWSALPRGDRFTFATLAEQSFRFRWNGAGFTMMLPLSTGALEITGTIATADKVRKQACQNALERLHPFIAALFEQWLLTRNAIGRMVHFSQAVESSGIATILLSDHAEIIHANRAAKAILDEQDGLRRCEDRLVCTHYADTQRLQAAMDHFRFSDTAATRSFNPVLAIARAKRRALMMALTAARPGAISGADELGAVAYVFDPDQDMTGILQPACRLHGLSNSETRLTCALVDGQSLKAAAQSMALQEQTARSYLKQIFGKTGTARQAELVQLMLKSAIRIAAGNRFEVLM